MLIVLVDFYSLGTLLVFMFCFGFGVVGGFFCCCLFVVFWLVGFGCFVCLFWFFVWLGLFVWVFLLTLNMKISF